MRRKVRPEGQTCQEASGDRSIPLFNMQGGSALDTTGHHTFKIGKVKKGPLIFSSGFLSHNLQGWQTMSLVGPPPPLLPRRSCLPRMSYMGGGYNVRRRPCLSPHVQKKEKGRGGGRGSGEEDYPPRRRHSLPLPPFLSRKDVLSPPAAARRGSSLRGITNRPSATHGSVTTAGGPTAASLGGRPAES